MLLISFMPLMLLIVLMILLLFMLLVILMLLMLFMKLRLIDVAEEAYCCGIRALEKLGRWPAAVALLEEWRTLDAYDDGKDAMVR